MLAVTAGALAVRALAAADLPATVVLTTGSYAGPAWLTSVPGGIVSGNIAGNAAGITGGITNSMLPVGAMAYAPTAVKTSAYNAVVGDLVPVDTTSGNVTVTLPAAPTDRARIAVKQVVRGGTNTVTVQAGGSDVFNTAGGGTTKTLTIASQAIQVEYAATPAIWYVIADDLPLAGLDTRYCQIASNLSDVTAATARTNLGVAQGSRTFGVSGTPVPNATTPPVYLPVAVTCISSVAACGTTPVTSPATITIQTAPDGTTWSTLVAISVAAGSYSGTASCTTSISAGTWLRGKFTAVNSVADMTGTIFFGG